MSEGLEHTLECLGPITEKQKKLFSVRVNVVLSGTHIATNMKRLLLATVSSLGSHRNEFPQIPISIGMCLSEFFIKQLPQL